MNQNNRIYVAMGRREKKNRGSIIVEMTLLMPLFLVCIYLYVMVFLYYIESGKQMNVVSESIYAEAESDGAGSRETLAGNLQVYEQSATRIGVFREEKKWAGIQVEMRRDVSSPVQNLRRWQMIADTVHERGNY